MENNVFREKNVNKISSPDSLNDYIRVVNPSIWITLSAIIVILVGVTIWGVYGKLDTVVKAVVISENNKTIVYINEKDAADVPTSGIITIEGKDIQYNIAKSIGENMTIEENGSLLSMLGDTQDTRVRSFDLKENFPDGVHSATIVVDSVKPMSFITN